MTGVVVIGRRDQNEGLGNAGGNHMVKGVLGFRVAKKGGGVAAPAMEEIDDRIAVRPIFIIAIGQIHVHRFFVGFFAVHIGVVLHLDHGAGLIAGRFVKFPVIEQVVGGHARQVACVQHGGGLKARLLSICPPRAAQERQQQSERQNFLRHDFPPEFIKRQGQSAPCPWVDII